MTFKVPQWLDKTIVWPVLAWRWFRYDHTFRKVKLLPDKYAKVEPKDFHEISKYTWWAKENAGNYVAVRFLPGGNCGMPVYMHRQIMNPSKGELVDHVNRDSTDNRRANLRIATKSQNNMNRKGRRGTSSKYKGVSWYTSRKCWRAMIQMEGENKFLGYFESETEAAKVYDEAARKYHGEFAYQNFENENRQLTRRARIRKVIIKIIHELIRLRQGYGETGTNLH